MMKHTLLFVLLATLIFSACAPAPTPKAAPSATQLPTSTPSPTATATPTPIPTIQVGDLVVPDPHYSNPELLELSKPDAPIPQFVNAMKTAGTDVDPEQLINNFNFQTFPGIDERKYVVAVTQNTGNSFSDGTPLLIAEQGENGDWVWRQNNWLLTANAKGFPIGIEIDPGHPNNKEQGYRDFVYNNANVINISGGLSHQWLRYGRAFTPQIVEEYKKRNPNTPLTIDVNHLFYHHDTFPPELTDQSIPLAERQQLARVYMRERSREVLEIIAPIMGKYPNIKITVNLGNEVFWEWKGSTGWEGEYSDFPLYDLLKKDWLSEAYVAFEEVREELELPRDRFTLLLNDFGAEMPGLASDYDLSQKQWVINEVAKRLGIPPEKVQLATGIQFGLEVYGLDPNDAGVIYKKKVLELLKTEEGRQRLVTHLNSLAGGFYVTELVTDDPETMNRMLEVFEKVDKDQIKGIIFWSAVMRPRPGESHYSRNSVIDKNTYVPLSSYYEVLKFLYSR
jgi:hypothetical protein